MRVLFLTHRLPYAPDKGDRLRAHHVLRELAEHARVDLVSLVHSAEEAGHGADLAGLVDRLVLLPVPRALNLVRGGAVLPTSRPLTHVLLDAPRARRALESLVAARRPDVVLAFCSGMARYALQPPLDRIPLVLDMVDVDSAKWGALAGTTGRPMSWIYAREARLLRRFEARAAALAHATLTVNERERATLAALAPGAHVRVVQNGVDVAAFRPPGPPASAPRVVFCGVFSYAPNAEGALWLAREVWPLVTRRRPDAELLLLGAEPGPAVRGLAAQDSSIRVTGAVPSVKPYLWDSSVAVAPLMLARGVQNKVLEAVAAGLPAVVTSAVAGGLPRDVLPATRTADSAWAFASAILELLGLAPEARRAAAARADLSRIDWKTRLGPLVPLLEAAADSAAGREVA